MAIILGLLVPTPTHAWGEDYAQALIRQAHEKHLAHQRDWQLLLHEHRNLCGIYESDIDDPAFFLSPHGRRQPEAELDATLRSFFDPIPQSTDTQHPQCRYPARYAWLNDQLHFDHRMPEISCTRFEAWRSRMDAQSATLVFASYYMNNPSSMYGHTFLRLNGQHHTDKDRLLDYTVNFSAHVTTRNSVLFAVYGLAGFYRGLFSTMPYYMKVQEYNNLDSRDLWEYPLNLPGEAMDRLVRHLWELGQTSMAYYFFNKNCSYQLLPLLEVADPALHLSNGFHIKAIPADTLRKVLSQPGLADRPHLRPSLVRQMLARRAQLDPSEVHLAAHLATHDETKDYQSLAALSLERQALVLDTAYDYFRYRHGFSRDLPEAVQTQEQSLLVHRSQLNVPAPDVPMRVLPASPDQGHLTGRVQLGFGMSSHSTFEELSARMAMHDLGDSPLGYVAGNQMEMFQIRLRYDNDRRTAYIRQATLVDLTSLTPWDRWIRAPSWKLNTGLDNALDLGKDPENSLYYGLNVGSGFSTHIMGPEILYAMADIDSGVGHPFQRGYRLGAGGDAGAILPFTAHTRALVQATFLRYPVGNVTNAVKLKAVQAIDLGKRFQFRASVERQNQYKEVLFTGNMYW